MRVSTWLVLAMCVEVVALAMVGRPGPADASPDKDPAEQAVHRHITAAKAGDVATLRSGACGALAAAMATRSDADVRHEFVNLYDLGPDVLSVRPQPSGDTVRRQTVAGFYLHVTDMDIAFTVEDHDGWKVCEIRRGNGMFGPLPGPFET